MTIKFKGTKISVSFFFALTVALIGIFDKTGSVFLCILSGILHETGHLAVLLFSREKPDKICFTPFGMRIERKADSALSFRAEAFCAFAGPLVNLVLFFVFRGTYFSKRSTYEEKRIYQMCYEIQSAVCFGDAVILDTGQGGGRG